MTLTAEEHRSQVESKISLTSCQLRVLPHAVPNKYRRYYISNTPHRRELYVLGTGFSACSGCACSLVSSCEPGAYGVASTSHCETTVQNGGPDLSHSTIRVSARRRRWEVLTRTERVRIPAELEQHMYVQPTAVHGEGCGVTTVIMPWSSSGYSQPTPIKSSIMIFYPAHWATN